jgi:hypothetical protein
MDGKMKKFLVMLTILIFVGVVVVQGNEPVHLSVEGTDKIKTSGNEKRGNSDGTSTPSTTTPTDPNLILAKQVVSSHYGQDLTVSTSSSSSSSSSNTYTFEDGNYEGTVTIENGNAYISSPLPADSSKYPVPAGSTARSVSYEYNKEGKSTGVSKWEISTKEGESESIYVGSTTSGRMVPSDGQSSGTTDSKTSTSSKKIKNEPVHQEQMCSAQGCSNYRMDIRDNSVWVQDGKKWVRCPETGGSADCTSARDYRNSNMPEPYNKPREPVKRTWSNYWDAFMRASGYSGITNFFFSDEDESDQLLKKDSTLYQILGGSEYMINEICLSGIDDTGDTTNVAFSPDTGGQAHAFVNGEVQEYINYSALNDENYTSVTAPTRYIYKISYEVSAGREGVDDCDITFNVRVKGANNNPYINNEDLVISSKAEPDNDANTSTISKVGSSMIVHTSRYKYSQVCIHYKDITQLCIDGIDDGEEQCSPIIESGTAPAVTDSDMDSDYAGFLGVLW